ncbi:unnamed protein product [Mortierella alpina]
MAPCPRLPSACSRVLLIQELQDLIRSILPFRDLKTCALVCRQWNSLFKPFLWRKIELHEHDRGKRTILRRHGNLVVELSSVHADKKTLRFIQKFCPYIQQLSLEMDHRSSWIHYDYLDGFFASVPHLTTLQIRFDAFQFGPAMFYSLSRLHSLTCLTMDVFLASKHHASKHHHPDAHMAILDCCPQLQELVVCGLFLEPPLTETQPPQTPFHQWVKRTLQPQRTHPTTLEEATQDPRHTKTWSASLPIHRLSQRLLKTHGHASKDTRHVPTVDKPVLVEPYRIQRLDFRSKRMDDDVFCRLIRRCPLLEHLSLEGVWVGISVSSWTVLSESCPRLLSLSIRHSDSVHSLPVETWLPTIETLTTFFPRLEDVTMRAIEFHKDPDLSTLGTHLQQLEDSSQGGSRRALKHLHYSGSIRRPLKVLLDIVTQIPSVESLTVGFTIDAIRPVREAQEPPPLELDKPWICQDTLVHLDLVSVSFADWTLFSQFFDHVQQLTRLRSLWISISHVREARGISASAAQDRDTTAALEPTGQQRSSSPPTSDDDGSSAPPLEQRVQGSSSSPGPHTSDMRPPGSFFWFRTLQVLQIGMAYYLNNRQWFERPIVFEEVVYVLQGTPALKRLDLKHISESGVVKRLSTHYPRIAFS